MATSLRKSLIFGRTTHKWVLTAMSSSHKAENTTSPKLVNSLKFATIKMDANTSAIIEINNLNLPLKVSMIPTAWRNAKPIQLHVPQLALSMVTILMLAQNVWVLAHTAEQPTGKSSLATLEKSGRQLTEMLERNLRVSLLSPTKSSQKPLNKLRNAHTAANANSSLASTTDSRD